VDVLDTFLRLAGKAGDIEIVDVARAFVQRVQKLQREAETAQERVAGLDVENRG
jgi:AmiR/NasT family two-component response regulator